MIDLMIIIVGYDYYDGVNEINVDINYGDADDDDD